MAKKKAPAITRIRVRSDMLYIARALEIIVYLIIIAAIIWIGFALFIGDVPATLKGIVTGLLAVTFTLFLLVLICMGCIAFANRHMGPDRVKFAFKSVIYGLALGLGLMLVIAANALAFYKFIVPYF